MNHEDELRRLRDANPVPSPVGYAQDEIGDRISRIRDRADGTVLTRQSAERHAHRGWRLPAIAASVVVAAIAVAGGVLLGRSGGSTTPGGPGSSPVQCAVSTAGGSSRTAHREARAEKVIASRVDRLGGTADAFVEGVSGTVGFTPRGISAAAAAQACRSTTATIRPLVTRPVPIDTSGTRSADPLSELSFPVPVDEAAFTRLPTAQQDRLMTAMSHYDCSGATAVLECTATGSPAGTRKVYLLASPIAAGSDFADSMALAPGTAGGHEPWSVLVQLTPTAAGRIRAVTTRFHTIDQSIRVTTCDATAGRPCEDFLAISVDRSVRIAPLTQAVLGSSFSVTGSLNSTSADELSTDVSAAAIGLRTG